MTSKKKQNFFDILYYSVNNLCIFVVYNKTNDMKKIEALIKLYRIAISYYYYENNNRCTVENWIEKVKEDNEGVINFLITQYGSDHIEAIKSL
jgi:hypothetical protein